jgi:hypothetical protein
MYYRSPFPQRQRVVATRAEETQRGLPSEHDGNKTHHYSWNDDAKEDLQAIMALQPDT